MLLGGNQVEHSSGERPPVDDPSASLVPSCPRNPSPSRSVASKRCDHLFGPLPNTRKIWAASAPRFDRNDDSTGIVRLSDGLLVLSAMHLALKKA